MKRTQMMKETGARRTWKRTSDGRLIGEKIYAELKENFGYVWWLKRNMPDTWDSLVEDLVKDIMDEIDMRHYINGTDSERDTKAEVNYAFETAENVLVFKKKNPSKLEKCLWKSYNEATELEEWVSDEIIVYRAYGIYMGI